MCSLIKIGALVHNEINKHNPVMHFKIKYSQNVTSENKCICIYQQLKDSDSGRSGYF